MNLSSIIGEGLRLAARARSLWIFGFFIALGSSGGGGGGQAGAPQPAAGGGGDSLLLLLAVPLVAVVVAGVVMRFLSEGAVIEGIRRMTRGEAVSVGQAFREGWDHIGTVLAIKIAYFLVSGGSIVLLALPCLLVLRLLGLNPLVAILGALAALIAVPWLLSLYIWQAFALRIAVLENRRAADAIAKARLFLHGHILQGLKLMIATLLGSVLVLVAGVALIAPLALLVAALSEPFGPLPVLVSLPFLLPAAAAFVAVIGTYQSSVWTLAYLRQVQA
jgi:hypothetical protein